MVPRHSRFSCALLSVTLGCLTWTSLHDGALLGICASPAPNDKTSLLFCHSAAFLLRVKTKPVWDFWIPPPIQKIICWGRQLDITGGQTREWDFSLNNYWFSSFQEPAFVATSQSGRAEEQKLQPLKAPHSKRCQTPRGYTSFLSLTYILWDVQHPLFTLYIPAAQIPVSPTQPANPRCFLKALDFLNLCYTAQSESSYALWDGKSMELPGMGNSCLGNSLHSLSSLSHPPATTHT